MKDYRLIECEYARAILTQMYDEGEIPAPVFSKRIRQLVDRASECSDIVGVEHFIRRAANTIRNRNGGEGEPTERERGVKR